MKLSIYNIIKKPVVTDKATRLLQEKNKITLEVHPKANKPLIAEALKKIFNVEVKDVKVIVRKGKARKFKRTESISKKRKRAIITLKEGYTLDMFSQAVPAGQPEEAGAALGKEKTEE